MAIIAPELRTAVVRFTWVIWHPVNQHCKTERSRHAIEGRLTESPTSDAVVITRLVLVAACALVDSDNRVLIAQRPPGKPMAGLWEFPGGKVESGERPEQTLIRELREELGIVVNEACLAPLTFASHDYSEFYLLMPLFICRRWDGSVRALEGQSLAWVRPNRLRDYPMPPADEPLVSHLCMVL
jgi:8-oxo-dGTP diphosphatase